MSIQTLAMICASIGFLFFVVKNINKNNISFDQAFLWLVIGFGLLIFALFEPIPKLLAHFLAFDLTSNFLLSMAIFVLLVLTFTHSLMLSKQKEQIKNLIQEISILKSHKDKSENKNEK